MKEEKMQRIYEIYAETVQDQTFRQMEMINLFGRTLGAPVVKDVALSIAVGVFMNIAWNTNEDVDAALEEYLARFKELVKGFNDPTMNCAVEHNKRVFAEGRGRDEQVQ